MPVYNEEYGTDWGKVLPEIGNQISNIIKNKREKPGLGAQQALEAAITNPDILKPENEAMLAQLLGANFTVEGANLARKMAEGPMFQELVKGKAAQAGMPVTQRENVAAMTGQAKAETAAIPVRTAASLEQVQLARDQLKIAAHTEELTQMYGEKRASELMGFQKDMRSLEVRALEAQAQDRALALAEMKGQWKAATDIKDLSDRREQASKDYFSVIDKIGDFGKSLIDPKFTAAPPANQAAMLADGALLMNGLITASARMQDLGLTNTGARTAITQFLHNLWFASGQKQAAFGEAYQKFLASMPPESAQLLDETFKDEIKRTTARDAIQSGGGEGGAKKDPSTVASHATRPDLGPTGLAALPGLPDEMWQGTIDLAHFFGMTDRQGTPPPGYTK